MLLSLLLLSLALARSPSYQRCISALANFEGFDGNETITLTFSSEYPEEELRQTAENLGHLIKEVRYCSDVWRSIEEEDKQTQDTIDQHTKKNSRNYKACEELLHEVEEQNKKRWWWNKLPAVVMHARNDQTEEDMNPCQRITFLPPTFKTWMPRGRIDCQHVLKLKVY